MSQGDGPWGRKDPEPKSPRVPRHRVLIWLAVLTASIFALSLASKAFPGAVRTGEDKAWLIRGFLLLALLSTGILTARYIDWGQKARHAAMWAVVVGVLALGITYWEDFAEVGQRVRSKFSASYPVAIRPHQLVVTGDGEGSFVIVGRVNQQPVRFLVDTGASDTVLSPDDAKRLGFDLAALKFDQTAETANGEGHGAKIRVRSLAVGDIAFTDFPVLINQAPMAGSLLGMSFLRRLESFQVKGSRLYLQGRE